MTKLEKNIIHQIDFKRDKLIDMNLDFDKPIISITRKIATEIREKYNETILDLIYQTYKDTDVDSVIVLDKSEFERFLLKYLPIYLEERNND